MPSRLRIACGRRGLPAPGRPGVGGRIVAGRVGLGLVGLGRPAVVSGLVAAIAIAGLRGRMAIGGLVAAVVLAGVSPVGASLAAGRGSLTLGGDWRRCACVTKGLP